MSFLPFALLWQRRPSLLDPPWELVAPLAFAALHLHVISGQMAQVGLPPGCLNAFVLARIEDGGHAPLQLTHRFQTRPLRSTAALR